MSRTILSIVVVVAWVGTPMAFGQEGHQHQHGHAHEEFVIPTHYRGAMHEIDHRMHEITELISSGELAEVHPQAEVIQQIAKKLGQLALKEDSGIAKDAVKEINVLGKDLASKFDTIDRAADSGNLEGTKVVYKEMTELVAKLRAFIPKVYKCPMKCEGDKTYSKPGKCPKCGMDLVELKAHGDHEAKHGGLFFMAADQKHHLEGVLLDSNEFRVYFYDEFTVPILAEMFTAEASVGPKGSDPSTRTKFSIKASSNKEYLTGVIDTSLKTPLSIRVFIDFKDDQKPQLFDFDFDQPVKHAESKNTEKKPASSHKEHSDHHGGH